MLRPQSAVSVLDTAVVLLRRRWLELYLRSVLGSSPLAVIAVLYHHWLETGTGSPLFYQSNMVWAAGLTVAWLGLVWGRVGVVARILEDLLPSAEEADERVAVSPKLFATAAGASLLTFGAGIWMLSCLIIPGVYVATGWWVTLPVILKERLTLQNALKRSWLLGSERRMQVVALFGVLVVVYGMVLLNLSLITEFLLGTAAGFFGIDNSGLARYLKFSNPWFLSWSVAATFLLLDPLKSVADAVLYVDLRVRREGLDLEERLKRLRVSALAIGGLLLWTSASPCLAAPDARKELLSRLGAGSGLGAAPGSQIGAIREPGDLKSTLGTILAAPEFQESGMRPEMRQLTRGLDFKPLERVLVRFRDWFYNILKRNQPATPQAGSPGGPTLRGLEWLLLGVVAVTCLVLLSLLVRAFLEAPGRRRRKKGAKVLAASNTENALDHSSEEWTAFARAWADRGELRQAIRSLYLSTLVSLHKARFIQYDPTRTNWMYVREYRGDEPGRSHLHRLTRLFEDVWYGQGQCDEEVMRRAETEVAGLAGRATERAVGNA